MARSYLRPLRALLVASIGLATAAGAADPIVREIEIRGLERLAEESVRHYLGLEVGRPLDRAALDRDILALWERELIDDIRVDSAPLADGIRLVVTLVERPLLRSLDFRDLDGMSRSDIDERMAREQIRLREGEPLRMGEVARLEALVEAEYRQRGFLFADASHTLETTAPGELRLVLSVQQAEKVRIGAIHFAGNSVFRNWRLRWAMKKTKEKGPLMRLLKKDVYNAGGLAEDLASLRELYRAQGYKDAVIGEPATEVVAGRRKRRLRLTIPIDEGERWKLGDIRIEGGAPFEPETLVARFERPRRDWLRAELIEKGVERIRDLYRNSGHIMADVRTVIDERPGQVADLVVTVVQGDQYRVGRIEFEGNSLTRDNVLRRELRVQEGMLVNMGGVKNSIFKINQLQYFELDEDDPVRFENFDSTSKTVDLVIRGEESGRYELQVGGGWSEAYGLFGQASAKTLNFLGRGESLGLSLQSGVNTTQYEASYSVPWLFERPQSIGVQLYDSTVDYTQYVDYENRQESRGTVLTYGRSFGLFQSLSLAYSAYDRFDQLSVLDAEGDLLPVEYDVVNSSLKLAYSFDSRDSRVEPTRGARLFSSVELAGGMLGGSNHFVRSELGGSVFLPVTRLPLPSVVGLNLRAGWIVPTQGRELVPLERYFLGGETSVRGFGFRDITVRCIGGESYPGRTRSACRSRERLIDDSFALLGGEKLVQLNFEYHLLVGGPFRVIGFLDLGNVYGEEQSIDLSRLRRSAGLELRLFVPVFGAPLRFIYAKNLAPIDDDDFQDFQFSIGATF